MTTKEDETTVDVPIARAGYIEALGTIVPGDSDEQADIRDALEWLRVSPHINKPLNMERHLGVMCVVLSPRRDLIYLMNHRKAQTWLPPGGHVDAGLSFPEAVEAEMLEELGVKADFIYTQPFFLTNTLTRGLNAGHIDTTAWFLVEGDPSIPLNVLEKEASEGRWMGFEQIRALPAETNLPRAILKLSTFNLPPVKL